MTEKIQTKFDLSIALALSTWPALTLAVQNLWGGSDSSEKRDWFAGAISDLLTTTPDADVEYVEEFLLQVMMDEFDVNIEDGSGEEIATKIIRLKNLTLQGDFTMVDEMYQQWQQRQRNGAIGITNFQHVSRGNEEDETDWDSDDLEDDEGGEDLEMREAPALVEAPREKTEPRIDEDGFTEVVSKKRRGR